MKNLHPEVKHLQDRSEEEVMAGYSTIIKAMIDLYERVKNLIGREEHRRMLKASIADLDDEINELEEEFNKLFR
jgi:rubrerythrin